MLILILLIDVENLQAKVHRVSELNSLPPSFSNLTNWTALDYFTFLMAEVAVVCSSPSVLPDRLLYKALVYLANAVYYLHYGKQSRGTQKLAHDNVALFSRWFVKSLGTSHCTHKFHVFQHFPEFLPVHGGAFLFDSFNLERLLGLLKKNITTRVNHVNQGVTNFLLRFHSPLLRSTAQYSESGREFLDSLKLDTSFYLNLSTLCLDVPKGQVNSTISPLHAQLFKDKLLKLFPENETIHAFAGLKRASRILHRNFILTSSLFQHTGQVNDSYCCVDERCVGQIVDICFTAEHGTCMILVQQYRRIIIKNFSGIPVLLPDNQFPVSVDPSTAQLKVFVLSDNLFIQKALLIDDVEIHGKVFTFFALRPNDFFNS
jgi:hypothetical protein